MRIVCVVEGHSEVQALPALLRRILPDLAPGIPFEIDRPIRSARARVDEIQKDVESAILLAGPGGRVLLLRDSDDALPCIAGPALAAEISLPKFRMPIYFSLAYREFESWFIAAAESLQGQRGLSRTLECPENFESIRDAKGWLSGHMSDPSGYSPMRDQVALAALFDISLARQRSHSFARFWRVCEEMLSHTATAPRDRSRPSPE